jgi:hypothetical protein
MTTQRGRRGRRLAGAPSAPATADLEPGLVRGDDPWE